MRTRVLNLANAARGGVQEMWDRAMSEVLENIDDPNTPAKKPRELVVRVVFLPTKDRLSAQVVYEVKTKLQHVNAAADHVYFGRVNGKLAACTVDENLDMFEALEESMVPQAESVPVFEESEGEGRPRLSMVNDRGGEE